MKRLPRNQGRGFGDTRSMVGAAVECGQVNLCLLEDVQEARKEDTSGRKDEEKRIQREEMRRVLMNKK